MLLNKREVRIVENLFRNNIIDDFLNPKDGRLLRSWFSPYLYLRIRQRCFSVFPRAFFLIYETDCVYNFMTFASNLQKNLKQILVKGEGHNTSAICVRSVHQKKTNAIETAAEITKVHIPYGTLEQYYTYLTRILHQIFR